MVEGLHLSPRHREEIVALLHKHLPGVEVWVYGSRVNGRSHDGSDLDLVLRGPKLAEIDTSQLADFIEALQNSTIPFLVEVRDWARLPKSFHHEIDREHVVLAEKEERDVVGEWCPTTIGGLLATDGGSVKTGPFGTALKAKEYSKVGVPLISVGEVGYGSLRLHEKTPRAPREVVERLPEYLLEAGDIVFGRKGAVDRSALVKPNQAGWFLGSDGIRLRLPTTCDSRFIAYQLQGEASRLWLLHHATGTTMASLNQEIIERVPIVLPPIEQQRAIAHILGTLDDKIELNRRMNETLEATARALFKSWFVDFDPVRAKMAGRDTGLPQHLADLFPDRLVDSELGEIPEGWAVVPLSEIMNFKEGPGIRHWQYTNSAEGTRFINIRCIQDGDLLLSTSNRITTEEADGKYAHFHLKEGDIVVSSSGTLGRSAVVRKAHLPLLLNTSVIRFRPIGGVTSFSYLHGYLNSSIFLDELKSLASGSVQKNVGPTHLKKMRVLFPPYNCIERYEEIAGPFLQKANIKRTDNAALTALRDTLLPRLVSGEVRVNVYDQRIEEAM